jgi:hypothetical protein
MQKIKSIAIIALILTVISLINSCKKERDIEAVIITDCTGKYLRTNGKDYKVCNTDKIENYTDGQIVEVTFKRTKECIDEGNNQFVCDLFHEFDSWAQVINIK